MLITSFLASSCYLVRMERRMASHTSKMVLVSCSTMKKVLHSSIISLKYMFKCCFTPFLLVFIINPRRSLSQGFSLFSRIVFLLAINDYLAQYPCIFGFSLQPFKLPLVYKNLKRNGPLLSLLNTIYGKLKTIFSRKPMESQIYNIQQMGNI